MICITRCIALYDCPFLNMLWYLSMSHCKMWIVTFITTNRIYHDIQKLILLGMFVVGVGLSVTVLIQYWFLPSSRRALTIWRSSLCEILAEGLGFRAVKQIMVEVRIHFWMEPTLYGLLQYILKYIHPWLFHVLYCGYIITIAKEM